MRSEDKAVLSTWLEYLRSLKMNPCAVDPSLEVDPDSSVVITGVNENLYNSVILQHPTDTLRLITELRTIQHDLDIPLTAWVTSDTNSLPLEKMLKEQFASPGPFYGMLLELKNANLSPCAAGITIEHVKNQQQAEEFAHVFSDVFNFPNLREHTINWATEQYKIGSPSALSYIARVNGVLAGICSLILDNTFNEFKTGGLYNACVRPEFRKLGVGTAMACHRINVAKKRGLQYLSIILMSDAMARGYCERIGFVSQGTLTPYFITPEC